MARVVETAVREGFICPICMKDLVTVDKLHQHFAVSHAELGSEDTVGNILSLINRAKKKIMQQPDPIAIAPYNASNVSTSSAPPEISQPNGRSYAFYENPHQSQPFGHFRELTSDFKMFRQSQMTRTALEMNKLLIRLEKLTSEDIPNEASKRKSHEQRIVPWIEDTLVKNCPSCGVKFGISLQVLQTGDLVRRKHHCRLCGYMICSDCSHFLSLDQARRLLDLVHSRVKFSSLPASSPTAHLSGDSEDDEEEEGDHLGPPLSFIQRTDSFSSLNSIIPGHPDAKNYELRCCSICREVLELKFKQIEEKHKTPFIVRLYDKLRSEMLEIDKLLPDYEKMSISIFQGKTTYSLGTVNDHRNDLIRRFEKLTTLSKRLEDQGKIGDLAQTHPRQALLLSSIGSYARRFVVDKMTPLRGLPQPETYEKLVLDRLERLRLEQEAEEKALRDKMNALKQRRSSANALQASQPRQSIGPQSTERGGATSGTGSSSRSNDSWIPAQQHQMTARQTLDGGEAENGTPQSSHDLLLETLEVQMTNVRNYLVQAKAAGRQTEVTTLQANLTELKAAYEQRRVELHLGT